MTRLAAVLALALLVALPVDALARERAGGSRGAVQHRSHRGYSGPRHRGGGHHRHHHRGHHHRHHHFFGPRTHFYGSFWYPGWAYRPYFYPYYPIYPYYPYYPAYPYPPASAPYPAAEEAGEPEEMPPPGDVDTVSYGLIQLEGIPDGAAVSLDGRFWLTANDLDDRWLALPEGEHRVVVTVGDDEPTERTVRIVPGRTHVLRFGIADRPT